MCCMYIHTYIIKKKNALLPFFFSFFPLSLAAQFIYLFLRGEKEKPLPLVLLCTYIHTYHTCIHTYIKKIKKSCPTHARKKRKKKQAFTAPGRSFSFFDDKLATINHHHHQSASQIGRAGHWQGGEKRVTVVLYTYHTALLLLLL